MLPEWLKEKENYAPPADGGAFAVKTIKALGEALSRLKIQKGHEKGHALPAMVKLIGLVLLILLVSLCRVRLFLLMAAACVQFYLCLWPAEDIWPVIRGSMLAAGLALLLFLPAMLLKPAGISNNLLVIGKVFLSVEMVTIFNHTTQWNHITGALRRLHVPGIFVFTLDITLKYIVLLGELLSSLLTALSLRSVGKNQKKYQSVGGVMGVTFLRSAEMSQQMYEAMQCRGFTDDYKGL